MSSSALRGKTSRPYSWAAVKVRPTAADGCEVGEAIAAGTRCPRCSAAMRPGAPWCTQCYASAGSAPAGAVLPEPPAARGGVRVVTPAPAPPSTGGWPCCACSQENSLADEVCAACGTPFLAAERERRPTVVLPVVGDLLAMSSVRRTGVAVCVVLAFVVTSALLALLLA